MELFRSKFPTLPLPRFFPGNFDDAVRAAARKRRPLFLYLHDHRESALIRYFLQNTISSPLAVEIIVFLPHAIDTE